MESGNNGSAANITLNLEDINNPTYSHTSLIITIFETLSFTSCVVGTILGNLLALTAFLKYRRTILKSPTHYFLVNLSLADLFVGIFALPFLGYFSVTLKWPFGSKFCFAWTILHFWFCSASILSTLGVCVERFVGVRYPLDYPVLMSENRVYIGCGSAWILSLLLSLVPLLVFPDDVEGEEICKPNLRLGHVLVASVGIFHVPATSMVVLYFMIYRSYKASIARVARISNQQDERCGISNGQSENNKEDFRLARKLTVLVGFLIISYLPMFTAFLFLGFNNSFVSLKTFVLLAWIRYFNSCLNPIIYAFSVPGFRRAFTMLIGWDKRKRNKRNGNTDMSVSGEANNKATNSSNL